MTGVLASEWVKIRSVRSIYYVFAGAGAVVLLAAVMAWFGATGWDMTPPARRIHFQGSPIEEFALPLVQLCLAVLGTLVITSEYSTGMIRASFVAVPRRWPVLAAKATHVAAIALVVGSVALFATFFAGRLIFGDRPIPGNTAPLSERAPILLSSGLSVMVVALVGLGLGAAMRSTAGALVAVCTLLFVLPGIARFLPSPWGERISAVMLPNLPNQLASAAHSTLPSLAALAVMTAYVVMALAVGAVVISWRDA
jgi:hypothetical protein